MTAQWSEPDDVDDAAEAAEMAEAAAAFEEFRRREAAGEVQYVPIDEVRRRLGKRSWWTVGRVIGD